MRKLGAPLPSLTAVLNNLHILAIFLDEIEVLVTPSADKQAALAVGAENIAVRMRQLETSCESQSDAPVTSFHLDNMSLLGRTLRPFSEEAGLRS